MSLPPPTLIAPSRSRQARWAASWTEAKDREGGFSAARLASAPARLTYEMPTLTFTGSAPGSNST